MFRFSITFATMPNFKMDGCGYDGDDGSGDEIGNGGGRVERWFGCSVLRRLSLLRL